MEPERTPDPTRIGVGDGFSLALVGDCIVSHPLRPLLGRDADFAGAVERLRRSTVAGGNLETSIVDMRSFAGHPRTTDDWGLAATPAVADDLRELGFGLLGRANNHAMDWGIEGMRETGKRLDAAGLAHAGAGESLAGARAPRYTETSLGRIGLVSLATTTHSDNDAALDPFGEVPGRPGVAALRLKRIATVPASTLDDLHELARKVQPWGDPDAEREGLDLLETRFVAGDVVEVRYEMDADDLAGVLRAVRLGAQHSDLLIVSAHIHQEGPHPTTPPAFASELARAAVDAGADVFVGHGVHRLWPIEMYRERAIFYGLGNFVFSDIAEPLHEGLYRSARRRLADRPTGDLTDADVTATLNVGFESDTFYESVIAGVGYDGEGLHVAVHPIDLGMNRPLTGRGIPRLADPERASHILKHLAEMSEPFGSDISADGSVTA